MFDFGRELGKAVPRDGMTGGDAALLDLLDLRLLKAEAKAADVAAGRISARDPAARQLEAALVWREVARRSGDAVALRKAAACAQSAATKFEATRRPSGLARARVEQAFCALLGAELFGDEGLEAAVAATLTPVASDPGPAGALALCGLAGLAGRRALAGGTMEDALSAAARFEAPLRRLDRAGKGSASLRLAAAEQRGVLADILAGCGARLKDQPLIDCALRELSLARGHVDAEYEPLMAARLDAQAGAASALLAELTGDAGAAADAVQLLTDAVEALPRDHSPLDWTRTQAQLGLALQVLGEATDTPRAFEQALRCYDRAHFGLRNQTALSLQAAVAAGRANCLGRLAELTGDLAVLDAAEAALRTELTAQGAGDPTAWAMRQLGLARLYELRVEITGRGANRLEGAALAYDAALEVFAEQGLRSLSDLAAQGLERIRERAES
ncbi:hypothetical protein GVN21_07975 [Caulobacter sp. SLTY]|uniref:hypothetical protein n=1 Tax=Caulobacter sp. SLTY TaxID=2683262 RepID=UPI0014129AFB|nr:hypothetical protein [Caulobacter sp. SLTY]NBB15291.1 hypothetical protein [Caulobacter sp. SLTY]